MELQVTKPVKVQAKTLKIFMKVRDTFCASLHDQDGEEICAQEDGYVPSFMPGDHYGDYLILDIDIDTGAVMNWRKPSADDMAKWIAKCSEN